MAVSWQALNAARQEVFRAGEETRLLNEREAARRMASLNLPYDPEHPPCHIRVKQAVVLGGFFIGGIMFIIIGGSLAGRGSLSFREAEGAIQLGLGIGMLLTGLFAMFASGFYSIYTCCSPVYRNEVDGTYRAYWSCMPCISAPCNTCHCTETDVRV